MAWVLSKAEIEAVTALDGPTRYAYFIKKVADENRVWSLWKDGWSLAENNNGQTVVPCWPHAKFAELCATGDWLDHKARPIEMQVWLDRWLPGITRDNRLIAVFPTPNDKGLILDSMRMAADLCVELQNYG